MFLVGSYNDLRLLATSDNYKIKLSKPDLYYGERTKLNNWLMQLNLYFKYSLKGIPETNKVPIAIMFIRNKAFF